MSGRGHNAELTSYFDKIPAVMLSYGFLREGPDATFEFLKEEAEVYEDKQKTIAGRVKQRKTRFGKK